MRKLKPEYLIFILFLSFTIVKGNVGGVFYKKSIAGISIDSSKSITRAETEIHCKDSTCTFKTTYHVNSNNCMFTGKFYGLRFSNISVNEIELNDSLIIVDTLKSDSILFGRVWVLEDYPAGSKIASIPISIQISEDSTFTIAGTLHTTKGENWGLAAFPNMVSLRHLWLNKPQIYNDQYSLCYLFAPIQSFSKLNQVTVKVIGDDITLLKRKWHRPMSVKDLAELSPAERNYDRQHLRNKDSTEELFGTNDTISWLVDIPGAIEYYYKVNSEPSYKKPVISLGGPLLFIGGRSKQFHSEIGWEVSINPVNFLSILPSATAAFNSKGYMDWSIGLRGYSMGYNIGINTREFKLVEVTFGVDIFGIIGIEGRNNAFLAKLSI